MSPSLKAHLALESLDPRVVPATYSWLGTYSSAATNPLNWQGPSQYSPPPGANDDVYFNQSAPDCIGLGGSVASLHILSGYSGTVSLGGSLTVGIYEQSAAALSQPADTNLTVTGTFTWTGGVLNNTPSNAYVNINGGGTITLPGTGTTLTSGSTLVFASLGGIQVTTITGAGTLLLNGTSPDGIFVRADAKVTVNLSVDPNTKSWIKNDTAKTLTLLAGSKGWTYSGNGEAQLDLRVINQGGLFKLEQLSGPRYLDVTLTGGDATTPSYVNNDNASAWLHITTRATLKTTNGIRIDGGSIYVIQGTQPGNAAISGGGKLVMNKGDIVFSPPVQLEDGSWMYAPLFVGDMDWNGGTYRPGIDCTRVGSRNQLVVLGTLKVTVAANNPNNPRIEPNIQFLPPGQQQPIGTWDVITTPAVGTGKLDGDNPTIPQGWTLLTESNANGVKTVWSIKK